VSQAGLPGLERLVLVVTTASIAVTFASSMVYRHSVAIDECGTRLSA
jgi:hypothetical protein